MKILHITASYKPSFIYGGPIYSVAALCELLVAKSLKLKTEGNKEVESQKSKVKSELNSVEISTKVCKLQHSHNTTTIQVYTTLANGKEELPYKNGQFRIIDGVVVTYFNRLTKDHSHFSPSLLLHLWKNAKEFGVIHIHSWWNLVSMGAVCICLFKGIKPVISPRGMLGDYTMSKSKSAFHRILGKYLLKKCNFHATTLMEAEEILQQVFNDGDEYRFVDLMEARKVEIGKLEGESWKGKLEGGKWKVESGKEYSKIFILHNLVKLPEKLPVKTRIFDGTLKLIFLSRIHHKKGIELLLDTLAPVNFPYQLSIVGEGDFDYVESLKLKVESLKLHDKVSWYGAVYDDEKFDLLTNHDAFILPSYNENFANVVIEAIAVGTPVLLSEHVGLKDFVIENNFGIVFKLEDFKTDLEKFYQLLSEGKFEINRDKLLNNENLIHQYLEMYALSSKF